MSVELIRTNDEALSKAEEFQLYYDGQQYDGLLDWWTERDSSGNYVSIWRRKPSVQYRLATTICRRVKAFTIGRPFPDFTVDEGDDVRGLVTWLRDNVLASVIPDAALNAAIQGASAVVFGFANGSLLCRTYRRTESWPVFTSDGQLAGLVIRYAGYHPETGKAVWFRGVLDSDAEVWDVAEQLGGPWTEWRRTEHRLGFVPAVWLRNQVSSPGAVDGASVLEGILPILKALDYSLSREDRALTYTADPQAVIEDENPQDVLKKMVRSPAGTWIVGKGGKIYYLEIDGKGIELQGEFASRMRKAALEVARVALTDPDNIQGGAMSGYALRMVHEAMIDLADEQRLILEQVLLELVCKMVASVLIMQGRGMRLNLPALSGYSGKSGWAWARATIARMVGGSGALAGDPVQLYHPWLGVARAWKQPGTVTGGWDFRVVWGPYFDLSPDEELAAMQTVAAARQAGVSSLESCVRTAAPLMRVGNVEEEIERVREENPLGGLM